MAILNDVEITKRLVDLSRSMEEQYDYEQTMARLGDHQKIEVDARIDMLKEVIRIISQPEWSKEDTRQLLKKYFR